MKTKNRTVAAAASVDVERWQVERDEVMSQMAGWFARVEPWRHAGDLVAGLMSDLPRKNCWTIAEHAGYDTPDALQNLLGRASWDDDGVRDELRGYVTGGLGDAGAVLVIDETGDLKKGSATVGTQRQYTGTAGRIENAQVAVYLTYATDGGHAFLDRELYLPTSWTDDPDRLAEAGVPDEVEFATKPDLAATMINRALGAGVHADWVAGDEVYGDNTGLREALEDREIGYVMAVSCDHQIPTKVGKQRADEIAASLPRRAWQTRSAGQGAKGPRLYEWALIDIHDPDDIAGHRWLLIRRHPRTGELAYYRCYAPHLVPLKTLVKVAGRRWTVEENLQSGKGLCGLDEHQVRTWTSWRRWTILSMLAHAILTVIASRERTARPTNSDDEMISLTCNEIAHLINAHTRPATDHEHCLRWSHWRRRHQYRAKLCHYQR